MEEYRGTPNIKRGGSLEVTMDLLAQETIEEITRIRAEAMTKKIMLVDKLTGVELPAGRVEEIKAYAARLHKKYPNWKPGRVANHSAAYFRLKLKK